MNAMEADLERSTFLEKHYTCNELAKAWGYSRDTVRKWFKDENGVLCDGETKLRRGRKRAYVTMRIPEHVVRRVYEKHIRSRS